MNPLWHGITGAVDLLLHPSAELRSVVRVTLELGFWSTLVCLLAGVPAGLALGLGRFPGRRPLLGIFNAGLGLPPVVVGLVVTVLCFNGAPLGSTHLLYTVHGMVVAQFFLGLPQVVALTAAAAAALDPALLAQARVLGAGRIAMAAFAAREARLGIAVGAIAALGSAMSEIGAAVLVGGNLPGKTQTAAGAVLVDVGEGRYADGIAVGILLIGLVLVISGGVTVLQQRQGRAGLRSVALGR